MRKKLLISLFFLAGFMGCQTSPNSPNRISEREILSAKKERLINEIVGIETRTPDKMQEEKQNLRELCSFLGKKEVENMSETDFFNGLPSSIRNNDIFMLLSVISRSEVMQRWLINGNKEDGNSVISMLGMDAIIKSLLPDNFDQLIAKCTELFKNCCEIRALS